MRFERLFALELDSCMPSPFRVDAPFKPAGDQPQAIEQLVEGVRSGLTQQVLAGVTGSGKTNVMAWAVEQLQRPVLVLSPNKTLAAQLCAEFRRLLPDCQNRWCRSGSTRTAGHRV